MSHTPEPWICDESGLVNGIESRKRFANWKNQPAPSTDIFDADEWPQELHDEAMANARLIAAAPNLLALARRVYAECGPVKMDLDACFGDTEWACGWCGKEAIDQSEITHKPDCLWLAAEALVKGAGTR